MDFRIAIVLLSVSALGHGAFIAKSNSFLADSTPLLAFHPVDKSMVIHQRQRRLIDIVSNTDKIGSCPLDVFQINVAACDSLLYKPYRDKTNGTCRSQLPALRNCVHKVYGACLVRYHFNATGKAKEIYDIAMNNTSVIQDICDNGGASMDVPESLTPLCDASFPVKYTKCVKVFHEIYTKNRGDSLLCGAYYNASSCVLTGVEESCSGNEIRMTVGIAKKMAVARRNVANPFCSRSQGGGDLNLILQGKLLTNGARTGSAHSNRMSRVISVVLATAAITVILLA